MPPSTPGFQNMNIAGPTPSSSSDDMPLFSSSQSSSKVLRFLIPATVVALSLGVITGFILPHSSTIPPSPSSTDPSSTDPSLPYDPFTTSPFIPWPLQSAPTSASHERVSPFPLTPTLANSTLIFVSAGDLHLSHPPYTTATPLTHGLGNELTPLLSPSGHTVAYTATYSGQRDLYVLPLTGGNGGAIRVTYLGTVSGVLRWDGESAIVFRARNLEKGRSVMRAYSVSLNRGEVTGLDLSETQTLSGLTPTGCLYFSQYTQSSQTYGYVGGTRPYLAMDCPGERVTRLMETWRGTSHYPKLYPMPAPGASGGDVVLYLSDEYEAESDVMGYMSLWAVVVSPTRVVSSRVKLTNECGYAVDDYDVDSVTGNVVIRRGSGLYVIEKEEIVAVVNGRAAGVVERRIEVTVFDDVMQMLPKEIAATSALVTQIDGQGDSIAVTVRGQTFLTTVKPQPDTPLPLIPSRVAQLHVDAGNAAGYNRVLSSKWLNETHFVTLRSDGGTWNGAELTVVVTDRRSMAVRRVAPAVPGSTRDGGLGSIKGRQFVCTYGSDSEGFCGWSDTDGRLVVLKVGGDENNTKVVNTWVKKWGTLRFEGSYLFAEVSEKNQFGGIMVCDVAAGWSDTLSLVRVTNPVGNSASPLLVRSGTGAASQIMFLSDRDVRSEVSSPWGSRAPNPYFKEESRVFVMDLKEVVWGEGGVSEEDEEDEEDGRFDMEKVVPRRAYAVAQIPALNFDVLIAQTLDNTAVTLLTTDGKLWVMDVATFQLEMVEAGVGECSVTSDRGGVVCGLVDGRVVRYENSVGGLAGGFGEIDLDFTVSVVPRVEFVSMFGDAWRMLRDYFYDDNMHAVDWVGMFWKYREWVDVVRTREELDDVFKHVAAELSALHVFVYGGEYRGVFEDERVARGHEIGSLCVGGSMGEEGFVVDDVYDVNLDFPTVDGRVVVNPLHDDWLMRTGQRGVGGGDVIVALDDVAVVGMVGLGMGLRGKVGRSVKVGIKNSDGGLRNVITRVIGGAECEDLRYSSWEWETRGKAVELAEQDTLTEGFSVGYIHMRSMSGVAAEDQFVRGYWQDFRKEGLIIDVRDNRGGSIDSWLLDLLSKRAWMFWQSRDANVTDGGLGWDQMGAFRGQVVVLTNEHTASDGEGFSRGVKTLGLGKIVGARTWGGGIWLSSDNRLVDGGLGGSAPEVGTYNDEWGWGLGIENVGVVPDVEVTVDAREEKGGRDEILERGIAELAKMVKEGRGEGGGWEIKRPGEKKSVEIKGGDCGN